MGGAEQRTALPRTDAGGRLNARMPGAGSGYIVVRRTARSRELDRIGEHRGWPLMIVSDSGTEMTSCAILAWQEKGSVPCTTSPGQAEAERVRRELHRPAP